MTQDHFKRLIGSPFTAFHPTGESTLLQVSEGEVQSSGVAPAVNLAVGVLAPPRPVRLALSHHGQQLFHPLRRERQDAAAGKLSADHGTLGSFAVLRVPGLFQDGTESCSATFSYLAQGAAPLSLQQMAQPALRR